MTNNQTPPAKKEFCVWADCVRRVCQHVEAETPEEAFRAANEGADDWRFCFGDEATCYRLSAEVQDVETEEYFTVGAARQCQTCGDAIEQSVNGSYFNEGECGACEHWRYRSQPKLVAACREMTGLIYRDKHGLEGIELAEYERAERACLEAITAAGHGSAA